jgi:hypothetical protein
VLGASARSTAPLIDAQRSTSPTGYTTYDYEVGRIQVYTRVP